MDFLLKSFSLAPIEKLAEIRTWVGQFPEQYRATAIDLVLKLKFVTTDVYVEWLKTKFLQFGEGPFAVYAVREFYRDEPQVLWDIAGESTKHVIASRGSEDLVRLVVASLLKLNKERFYDHPSLNELREKKLGQIVLVDDSIGSGNRLSKYLKAMLSNRSFLSWWSYGKIRFHVLAFARNKEADEVIIDNMVGSDHPKRRYPKSQKITFHSYKTYRAKSLKQHWGSGFQSIVELCQSVHALPKEKRLGFGNTMSNIVFYHSIPNNIPGVLWARSHAWQPLFPRRVLPIWAQHLLNKSNSINPGDKISRILITLLRHIKRGVKTKSSLARELGFDVAIIEHLISAAYASGFVTDKNRLTRAGAEVVWKARELPSQYDYDRGLYIPKKWRVDRETVQPFD